MKEKIENKFSPEVAQKLIDMFQDKYEIQHISVEDLNKKAISIRPPKKLYALLENGKIFLAEIGEDGTPDIIQLEIINPNDLRVI